MVEMRARSSTVLANETSEVYECKETGSVSLTEPEKESGGRRMENEWNDNTFPRIGLLKCNKGLAHCLLTYNDGAIFK